MAPVPHLCVFGGSGTSVPCEGGVRYQVIPFAFEIHDDDTKVFICEQHAYESAMEI